ncbi:MAG: nucleotidyltransferase domain-containing protein [Burkholderiaceae bacterium]|nr:nucleotidyltransferase domain-containing protein [Burkholderiaceae bacterium]
MQNQPVEQDQRVQRNIEQVQQVLANFGHVVFAILFGSMAKGTERVDSDLDLAVLASKPLSAKQRIELIDALALEIGRPVDLIDLRMVGQPLLNQILKYGQRVVGTDEQLGALVYRNLVDRADFLPLQDRILKEANTAWISK